MLSSSVLTVILVIPLVMNVIASRGERHSRTDCALFPYVIPNAFVKLAAVSNNNVADISDDNNRVAHVTCADRFDLRGNRTFRCTDGRWPDNIYVECVRRCSSAPPDIPNSYVTMLNEQLDQHNFYHNGVTAQYFCSSGYYLPAFDTFQLTCTNGSWTGAISYCLPDVWLSTNRSSPPLVNGGVSCTQPRRPLNGNYKYEKFVVGQLNNVGQRIRYVCNDGFQLHGASTHECLDSGRWFPGGLPTCESVECDSPPSVQYATFYNLNHTGYQSAFITKYPIKSQIAYQCLPGYILQGNDVLRCTIDGTWWPITPPICFKNNENYYLEVNSINAVLISAATGAGVLGLLLLICVFVICRRKKPFTRAVAISNPAQQAALGDHATLLHYPDRLALIAFAEGYQNDQAVLPTYDEATRERGPVTMAVNRLHRPNLQYLPNRRMRNNQGPEMVHITRHGSFVSHTPSIRSGGDSMGSTDTVAMSEGSTNVTLDTVSSHSGSQPASCRVHCGSLASFDTSSVVNTEGVPLLEESELEDVQSGDIALTIETQQITDNASHKLSIASGDIC